MPGGVIRAFPDSFFGNGSSVSKGRKRLFFIVQKSIDRALEKFSWLVKVRGILRQLVYNRERLGESLLQQQKLHTRECDEPVWIDACRHFSQLFLHHTEISLPIHRKLCLLHARSE